MTQPQVIEGTAKEILEHVKGLDGDTRLMLFIPTKGERMVEANSLHNASPEVRAKALDAIAAMNKDVPVLAPEAYNRASLYEENI